MHVQVAASTMSKSGLPLGRTARLVLLTNLSPSSSSWFTRKLSWNLKLAPSLIVSPVALRLSRPA